MRKQATTSSEYDYQVVQEPLFNRDGKPVMVGSSPVMGNFRTDNDVCLGTSTEKYEIVNNGSIVEKVEEALIKNGLGGFDSKKYVARDGARFYGVYDFANETRNVAVGDAVGMRLTLNNSFDRSCGVSWSIGLLRRVCSNGMNAIVTDTSVTKKHSSKLDLAFIGDSIADCREKFASSVEMFQGLRAHAITKEQGGLILDNLAIKKVLADSMRDSIRMIWDNEDYLNQDKLSQRSDNLYNLYNATTQHLTHQVDGFEYANRISKSMLKNLVKAQTNAKRFSELTAKVPEKEKTVKVVTLTA
jgi:hypothetical protein|tara:strand:- start:193 stop:1095 length:903 start_codon:yes stop_codon:yes gene_type:complete